MTHLEVAIQNYGLLSSELHSTSIKILSIWKYGELKLHTILLR